METIDITDLPEPLARAVETMVNGLREQVAPKKGSTTQPLALPKWAQQARRSD